MSIPEIELYAAKQHMSISDKAELYFDQGIELFADGQIELVIKCFSEAIRLKPNYTDAYYRRGNAYGYSLRQYERAIQDYNKAIQLNPNEASYYDGLGFVYMFGLGQYDIALSYYAKAMNLKPNVRDYYENYQQCLRACERSRRPG